MGKRTTARDQEKIAKLVESFLLGSISIDELIEIGEPALEQLEKALNRPEERGKVGCILAIGRFGPSGIEVLIRALDNDYWRVRREAVKILGRIGDPRATDPLIRALNDPHPYVKKRAEVAVFRMGEQMIKPLLNVLKNDKRWAARKRAMHLLGRFKEKKAVDLLLDSLQDKNSFIRREASEVLGKIGSKKAVDPLIHLLKDGQIEVRTAAAKALGDIGDKRALDVIKKEAENLPKIENLFKEPIYYREMSIYRRYEGAVWGTFHKLHDVKRGQS